MTDEAITAALAQRVMGWSVGPDRFCTGQRGWLPRWKFRPTENLNDALRLLKAATPESYVMGFSDKGVYWARVQIAGSVGEACGPTQARAITIAVAQAFGVYVESSGLSLIDAAGSKAEAR